MDDRFSPRSAHSDDALAQTFCDPMFEPQPSFSFADSQGEEAPGMHQTMGSPQAPNQNPHAFFNPVNGNSFDAAFFQDNTNQYQQNTGVFGQQSLPVRPWENQGMGGGDGGGFNPSFPKANSMQQIVQQRRSANQQFGQITPPDDTMSDLADPKNTAAEAAVNEAAERARTDKSERARNAANQRHAKTPMYSALIHCLQ